MEYGIILANANPADVPADFWKNIIIVALIVFSVVMAVLNYRKRGEKSSISVADQPVAATISGPVQTLSVDKFATRDFCEMRHVEVTRRLDGHDNEIANLRATAKEDRADNQIHASQRSQTIHKKIEDVRTELTGKIDGLRHEMSSGFGDIERALGRIEGKQSRDDG